MSTYLKVVVAKVFTVFPGVFLFRYFHIWTHTLERPIGEFPCLLPRIITVPAFFCYVIMAILASIPF